MPVSPPRTGPMGRFEPRYLTEEDLDDLASFTGLDRDRCLERVQTYSMQEMTEAWRQADPHTPAQILDFYRTTDLYIWEQMQWHASPARDHHWLALQHLVSRYPAQQGYERVLEFGGGIGTDALYLTSQGYHLTLVDVNGPAFRFAQHRFARRGLDARFVESRSSLPAPQGRYDVVVSFDVFEHLPDPLEAARRLIGCLRDGGVVVQTGGFLDEGHHPCHLEEGVHRFGGLKWDIHLAGLGLRKEGPNVFVKVQGPVRWAQLARYRIWRATGLWISRVPA